VLRVNPSGTNPPQAYGGSTQDAESGAIRSAIDSWGLQDYTFERTVADHGEAPRRLRETVATVLGVAALLGLAALLLWALAHQVGGSLDLWANKLGELVDEWNGPW
jgi:hypothetical protein